MNVSYCFKFFIYKIVYKSMLLVTIYYNHLSTLKFKSYYLAMILNPFIMYLKKYSWYLEVK